MVCDPTSIASSIYALETAWLAPFWFASSIQGDQEFHNAPFKEFCHSIGASFHPFLPCLHSKNVIKSKRGVLRSILIRIRAHLPQTPTSMAVQIAIRVSIDLYASSALSAYAIVDGHSRPLSGLPWPLPTALRDDHSTQFSKRNLCRILFSKSSCLQCLSPGDLVEANVHPDGTKRKTWTSQRNVLSLDRASWTRMLPGALGQTFKASLEDLGPALIEEAFARIVREANDEHEADL